MMIYMKNFIKIKWILCNILCIYFKINYITNSYWYILNRFLLCSKSILWNIPDIYTEINISYNLAYILKHNHHILQFLLKMNWYDMSKSLRLSCNLLFHSCLMELSNSNKSFYYLKIIGKKYSFKFHLNDIF